jgi:dihydroorotase
VLTSEPGRVLGTALGTLQASAGQLVEGGVADLCVFDPQAAWTVQPDALRSQGKHTPFSGYELPGRVRCTLVGGQLAYEGGKARAHPKSPAAAWRHVLRGLCMRIAAG